MGKPLIKQQNASNRKWLLFTSAGDFSCLELWDKPGRMYDIWVTYYGDLHGKFAEHADYYVENKGSKFQNLYYAYKHYRYVLDQYEAIFVVDDDLVMSELDINRLFEIREMYDLSIVQPAYDDRGKSSHRVLKVKLLSKLRYTNFIEVACPLFRKDKLDMFMKHYDPEISGRGIDYWYCQVIAKYPKREFAVADEVVCINPHDQVKNGQREIDVLYSFEQRKQQWEQMKKRYDLTEYPVRALHRVHNLFSLQAWRRAVGILSRKWALKINRKMSQFSGND